MGHFMPDKTFRLRSMNMTIADLEQMKVGLLKCLRENRPPAGISANNYESSKWRNMVTNRVNQIDSALAYRQQTSDKKATIPTNGRSVSQEEQNASAELGEKVNEITMGDTFGKTKKLAKNVGFYAAIGGIGGYVGARLIKQNGLLGGVIGALIGGTAAYFITQGVDKKAAKKEEEKKQENTEKSENQ